MERIFAFKADEEAREVKRTSVGGSVPVIWCPFCDTSRQYDGQPGSHCAKVVDPKHPETACGAEFMTASQVQGAVEPEQSSPEFAEDGTPLSSVVDYTITIESLPDPTGFEGRDDTEKLVNSLVGQHGVEPPVHPDEQEPMPDLKPIADYSVRAFMQVEENLNRAQLREVREVEADGEGGGMNRKSLIEAIDSGITRIEREYAEDAVDFKRDVVEWMQANPAEPPQS